MMQCPRIITNIEGSHSSRVLFYPALFDAQILSVFHGWNRVPFHLILFALLLLGLCLHATPCKAADKPPLDYLEFYLLGQQHKSDPATARINRLEQASSGQVNSTESMDLRMARLLASAQVQGAVSSQREAIKAYNQGVDAMSQGGNEEALKHFQISTRLDPRMLQAYNNMATVLDNMGRPEAAVQAIENAIRISPDDPLLYRNLGVLLEKSGQIEKAMVAYRAYLRRSPPGKDPAIADAVQLFNQSPRQEADYFAVITSASEGKILSWPRSAQPVTVHVNFSDPGQAQFLPLIRSAFQNWEQATDSVLTFQEVTEPRKARILIDLHPGPLNHPSDGVGHARYVVQNTEHPERTLQVMISVNIGEAAHPVSPAQQQQQISRVVLHELGHAIGIWGHSANPLDVMYIHPLVSSLSSRDVQTVRKLYGRTPRFFSSVFH